MVTTRQAAVAALGAACVAAALAPQAAQSDGGILWDLLVRVDLREGVVQAGQTPAVAGHVTDHAGDPVVGADVLIRSGSLTFRTATDGRGMFGQELTGFDGLPGIYVVNTSVSLGEGRGFSSAEFQVSGDVRESQVLLRQIETSTAQRYLSADEGDFAGDPIGSRLYHYYHHIHGEYLLALTAEDARAGAGDAVDEKREAARQLLQNEIDEKDPGAGTYGGRGYERFVDGLDPSVRDTFVVQLNHTTSSFYEAQELMRSILRDGGTYEEARAAYLGRLAITQEMMGSLSAGEGWQAAPASAHASAETDSISGIAERVTIQFTTVSARPA